MKLLFILTYYYPHWTGLTQYAKRLAEGLANRKYDVQVITSKHENNLKNEEIVNGVSVTRKPVLFRISRTSISPQLIFSLWKKIRQTDKVIVYLPFAEVVMVAIITKIFNKKLFLVHNGDLVLPQGLKNQLIEKIFYLSTSLAIRLSEAIIIQTEDYAEHSSLLSRFRNKWKVILPLYKTVREENNEVAIAKLQAVLKPGQDYTVGFAGRFVEEKGVDILLSAMAHVLKKLPKTKFVFAGETNIPYENFFGKNQKLIEKNRQSLVFLGKLTQEEMREFYKWCSILIISSRTDCFPSAEVEAMLAGVPVVVTDIPGARWPVLMTGMGILVKTEDPEALANGIVGLLTEREKYIQRSESVYKVFDYHKTLDLYEKVITR